MSQQQQPQQLSMDAMIAHAVTHQLQHSFSGITAGVMNQIGLALRRTAGQMTATVDVGEFISTPAKLSDGSAIIITKRFRFGTNNIKLLVLHTEQGLKLQPFIENEDDLTQSQIVSLTEEQSSEILRQLTAAGVQQTILLAILVVDTKTVQGVEWFQTEEQKAAAAAAEGHSETNGTDVLAAGQGSEAVNETPVAPKGPTPIH